MIINTFNKNILITIEQNIMAIISQNRSNGTTPSASANDCNFRVIFDCHIQFRKYCIIPIPPFNNIK